MKVLRNVARADIHKMEWIPSIARENKKFRDACGPRAICGFFTLSSGELVYFESARDDKAIDDLQASLEKELQGAVVPDNARGVVRKKRTNKFAFTLSDEESQQLYTAVNASGLSLAAYIRVKLLKTKGNIL